ncbi:MAG: sulfate adenylyltransferase, partial [Dehalococcoidia bacterium]
MPSLLVDNALSPHGGKLVERVLAPEKVLDQISGLKSIPVRGQIATECIDIAYGFFSPLEGFMGRADVDSVAREMRLVSGYVWSVPVIFDLSDDEIKEQGLKDGETLLLTHQGQPLAT